MFFFLAYLSGPTWTVKEKSNPNNKTLDDGARHQDQTGNQVDA